MIYFHMGWKAPWYRWILSDLGSYAWLVLGWEMAKEGSAEGGGDKPHLLLTSLESPCCGCHKSVVT